MATLEELERGLVAADAAGNSADAQVFADEIRRVRGSGDVSQNWGGIEPQQDQTSAGGAFGREAARSVVPGAAGWAGGALAGAGAGALGGPFAPITVPVSALAGGLAAAFGARKLQDTIADEVAPDSWFGTQQAALDAEQHPIASFTGGLIAQGKPGLSNLSGAVRSIGTSEGRALLGQAARTMGNAEAVAALRQSAPEALEQFGNVFNVASGAGIGTGMSIASGESPGMVAANLLGGAVFNRGHFEGPHETLPPESRPVSVEPPVEGQGPLPAETRPANFPEMLPGMPEARPVQMEAAPEASPEPIPEQVPLDPRLNPELSMPDLPPENPASTPIPEQPQGVRPVPEPGPWDDVPVRQAPVEIPPTEIKQEIPAPAELITPPIPSNEPVREEAPRPSEAIPQAEPAKLEEPAPSPVEIGTALEKGQRVVSTQHGPGEVVNDLGNRVSVKFDDGQKRGVAKKALVMESHPDVGIPTSAQTVETPNLESRLAAKSESLGKSIETDVAEGRNYSAIFPGADPVTAKRIYKLAVDTALAAVRTGKRIGQAANIAIQKLKSLGYSFNEGELRRELNKNLPGDVELDQTAGRHMQEKAREFAMEDFKAGKPKPTPEEFSQRMAEAFPDHPERVKETAYELHKAYDDPALRENEYPESKGNPETEQFKADTSESFRQVVQDVKSGKTGRAVLQKVADINNRFFGSKASRAERIADGKLPGTTKSELVQRYVKEVFGSKPGADGEGAAGAIRESVHNGIRILNQVDDAGAILKPRLDKMAGKQQDTFLNRMGDLLVNPEVDLAKEPADVRQFISEVQRITKENANMLEDAGYEIGDFGDRAQSRIVDREKRIANPDKFHKGAVEAYKAKYAREFAEATEQGDLKAADAWRKKLNSPDQAEKDAFAWERNLDAEDAGITADGDDFRLSPGSGLPDFLKAREFGPEAEKHLGDFYVRNPLRVLEITSNAANRLKLQAEVLGKKGADGKLDQLGKWDEIRAKAIEEGNIKMLAPLADVISKSLGMGEKVGPFAQKFNEFTRFWTQVTFLDRAVISSLAEPLQIGVATGSVRDSAKAFARQMTDTYQALRGMPKPARAFLAERLGFTSSGMMSAMSAARASDPYVSGTLGKIGNKFHRMTGLEMFTRITHWAGAQAGAETVHSLARMVDLDAKPGQLKARRSLEQLGIKDEAQLKSLKEFAKTLDGKDTDANLHTIATADGEGADLFRKAIGLFVRSAVLEPTRADKPLYAEHPVGNMFYSLQGFLQAYSRNVAGRIIRDAATGIKGKATVMGKEVQLSPSERVELALKVPAMATLGMGAANLGIVALREALFSDPERRRKDANKTAGEIWTGRVLNAASRANFLGPYDPLYNAFTSAKYQRDPATTMVGPIWGSVSEMFKEIASQGGKTDSPNNNKSERKLAKLTYQIGVKPLESAALTTLPWTRAAGAANYVISHPEAREAFVNALTGPPTPKSSSSSTRKQY